MIPHMEPTTEQITAPPAARRGRSRRAVGIVAVALLAVASLAGCLSEEQQTVQTQINNSRKSANRAALADWDVSDIKAQDWAERLAKKGSLSHSNLAAGYTTGTWCRLAENVGMGPNLATIHQAFMNSPGHRANILNPAFTHMGTGVAKKGNTWFVVHEFAQRC